LFEKLKSGLNGFVNKVSQKGLSDKEISQILDDFLLVLVENDVAYSVGKQICENLKTELREIQVKRFGNSAESAKSVLRDVLVALLRGSGDSKFFETLNQCKAEHRPTVILFVGVNGTGKTSTIAKIGHLLLADGFSVIVAAADTYRTGSIEQIEEHARRIGIRTIKHDYGGDAAAVAFDAVNFAKAHAINVILIDTAGRMQTNRNLLEEMKKIARVAKPDLTVLVVDALTGNDAVEQGRIFSEAVPIDGIILTKLDADAKGGSAISMASIIGKPIFFASVGQNYEDLVPFNPDQMIARIVE
jgi:fused signal recognition particle receptor